MASNNRHAGYDNCKSIFIFYIVLLHLCHVDLIGWMNLDAKWSPSMKTLFQGYNMWHEKLSIPGFVFISGFFGKGFLPAATTTTTVEQPIITGKKKSDHLRWEKTISVLLVGSGLLQMSYFAIASLGSRLVTGQWIAPPTSFPLFERLETWYLIALALWRLSTPLIARLRYPIASSFLIALIGLHAQMEGPMDTRMRVLHFLPYYVLGLYCQERHLDSIRRPRVLGVAGIVLTSMICLQADKQFLAHVYLVESWEVSAHLHFFLQYLLCGVEVISVIFLVRSIRKPIFPFSHGSSTLAIYEWHWPIVNLITWGSIPFTAINIPGVSEPSLFMYMAKNWHPLFTFFAVHGLAFLICIGLGSERFWRLVRPISDPNCTRLFVPQPQSSSDDDNNNNSKSRNKAEHDAQEDYETQTLLEKGMVD